MKIKHPLTVFVSTLLLGGPTVAQNTPAHPVPPDRWDKIEPRAILDDITWFTGSQGEPNCAYLSQSGASQRIPFFFDADIENGYLFIAAGELVQIYDARTNRADPPLVAELCRPAIPATDWRKNGDENWSLKGIDAPAGNPDVVMVGIGAGNGVIILDAKSPGETRPIYRDRGFVEDVVALRAGARNLGFAVGEGPTPQPVEIYDLDAASARVLPCVETTSAGQTSCGVWIGRLEDDDVVIAATQIAGAGPYLVAADPGGFRVFDVSDPDDPVVVSNGSFEPRLYMPSSEARPLTAWMHAGKLFVAGSSSHSTAPKKRVRIYDTHIDDPSCSATSPCSATLDLTVDLTTLEDGSANPYLPSRLNASVDGGTPLLWIGNDALRAGGPQREFLFDLSDLQSPVELTPKVHPDGYWGWYYELNPDPAGFNRVAPYAGVVLDGFLYRAASTLLDVHELLGEEPPVADFVLDAQEPLFLDDSIELLDASSRRPLSWAWDLDGVQFSDQQNPTWTVPPCPNGTYPCTRTITLTVSNEYGSDSAWRTITVYDPDSAPMQILSFDVACNALFCEASAGQPVSFDLEYNGRPVAFDYDWDGDGTFEDSGNPTPKPEHVYQYGGTYSPRARVRREEDEATAPSDPDQIFVDGPAGPSPSIFSDGFETGGFENWQ